MKLNKKGASGMSGVNTGLINSWIVGIILVIVLFIVLAELIPEFITAVTSIGDITDLPFASFFGAGGIIVILLVVAIVLVALKIFLPSVKR